MKTEGMWDYPLPLTNLIDFYKLKTCKKPVVPFSKPMLYKKKSCKLGQMAMPNLCILL